MGGNPTPRRRLGWHRNSPLRRPDPKPDRLLGQFQPTDGRSTYELRLAADGQGLIWVAADDEGVERLGPEPAPPWWQRLKLGLLSRLIPDDLL